jgi:hypothetical protein
MNERRRTVLLLAAMALVAGGCGGGEKVPSLAKVHGKVSYNGKPMALGKVLFIPVKRGEGETRPFPAGAEIQPDGTYVLTTVNPGDGAAIGEHKVVMHVFEEPGKRKGPPRGGTMMRSLVPEKYS